MKTREGSAAPLGATLYYTRVFAGSLCPPWLKGARKEGEPWTWWESCVEMVLGQELAVARQTQIIWVASRVEAGHERLWPPSPPAFSGPAGASGWLNPTGSLLQSTQASLPGKRPGWRGWKRIWRENQKRSTYGHISFLCFEGSSSRLSHIQGKPGLLTLALLSAISSKKDSS